MKQYVCLFLLFMVFCFSLDTLAYGNYQTSTEGVKNLDLALDETYYLELVSAKQGQLELKQVEKLEEPIKTIVIKYYQDPIGGTTLEVTNPFSQKLLMNVKVKFSSFTGYESIVMKPIADSFKKQWKQNIYGVVVSDFHLTKYP